MAFSDTVQRVIKLATTIRDYWDAELPKRHPDYPLVHEGEDDGPPPPEEAELRALLQSLPPEDVGKIRALMFLGQGRYPAKAFPDQWRVIAREDAETGWAIERLAQYPALADDLLDALDALSSAGIDVDTGPSPVATGN